MTEVYRQGFLARCRRAGMGDAQALSLLALLPLMKKAEGSDPELQRAEAIFKDWLTVPRHTVRMGEVLSGIARQHGVGLKELMDFNQMKSPFVRTGQTIRIPPRQARKGSK